MNFPEYAAFLLSVVSVLVTILGVFMAVLAIWGYAQFRRTAKNAARKHIASQIASGSLRKEIEELIIAHITKEMMDGKLRQIFEERANVILLGGGSARSAQVRGYGDESKEYGE